MKIKIVHISQSLGGVESYIKGVIGHIDQDKFELKVITPYSATLSAYCKEHGVEYIAYEMSRGFNIIKDIKTIFFIKKYIKQYQPNLVHLHSSKAGVLGRIATKQTKTVSVFTPHGISYLSFTGIKRLVFSFIEVLVKSYTQNLLAVSYSEANRLIYEIGFHSSKVSVILNSTAIVPTDNKALTFDTEKEIIKIGTIARLTYQKNPLLLADVANLIINGSYSYSSKVHFYVMGAGMHDHLLNELNQKIADYKIADRFHILDWTDANGVGAYLNNLDVFILTSIFEGLPLSLLEAMAIGKPCVVSKCDGCNDVIDSNENGFACMEASQYAEAIHKLIEQPQLYATISLNAKNYIQKHHYSPHSIKLLEAYYVKTMSTR